MTRRNSFDADLEYLEHGEDNANAEILDDNADSVWDNKKEARKNVDES